MRRRRQGGSALLEVALAMALMATCGMGLLSAQLALARHASASATRARAAFAVDALVETALETGSPARDQWRARASALVANAQVNLSTSQVTLSWTDLRDEAAAGRDCAGTSAPEGGRACVALAFAQ